MSRITSSSSGGNVNIQDSDGLPLTSTSGALNVNVVSAASGAQVLTYNELSLVPTGVETTIVSYTVLGTSGSLVVANLSSQNIGYSTVYLNAQPIDKQYITYTKFNLLFDFSSLPLSNGDIIEVKATNQGNSPCDMNAKIQVVEV